MIRKMVCLAAILLGLTAIASAAPWALWQGNVSDDFSDPANWVDGNGAPLGHMPDYLTDTCVGFGRSKGGTYWPVLYDKPLAGSSFSAKENLTSLSEWSGQYSKFTIAGGKYWMEANQYFVIGRHTGDTGEVIINSGGIGGYIQNPSTGAWILSGPTRWLRVGRGDNAAEGGLATLTMNGGKVYAQAMSVGNTAGNAGSSATVNDGAELYVGGVDYTNASFDIQANASMTVNPGGYLELNAGALRNDVGGNVVQARGALNIVADGTGSGQLVISKLLFTETALRSWFGYDDGSGVVPGNVNAIYNGGPGQFVFTFDDLRSLVVVTVIPEPATIALLGIGGLCLLRRKRS